MLTRYNSSIERVSTYLCQAPLCTLDRCLFPVLLEQILVENN